MSRLRSFGGLARLHKDQILGEATEQPRVIPAAAAHIVRPMGKKITSTDRPDPAAVQVLKWFFLFVTLAFCVSTGLGLWLGFRAVRRQQLSWILLSCGTAIPTVLALLTG